jgi:hypothetical protein
MGWPITSSTPHVLSPGAFYCGSQRREEAGRTGCAGRARGPGCPAATSVAWAMVVASRTAVSQAAPGWPRFQSGALIPSHADPARRTTRRKRARPAQTGGQKARSVPASIPEQGTAGQNRFRHQRFFGSIWCASYRGGTSTLACRHEKSPRRRAAACASTPNDAEFVLCGGRQSWWPARCRSTGYACPSGMTSGC